MDFLTTQQITDYYERHKTTELTLTKDIIEAAGIVTKQIALKCREDLLPCVIYSLSFSNAKIIADSRTGLVQKLKDANQVGSLRLYFNNGTANPLVSFVTFKMGWYTPYGGDKDMALMQLQFTNRPPDDVIIIMGKILDAYANFIKHKEERIPITPETQNKLHIVSPTTFIFIQGFKSPCILRDISFYDAKVIVMVPFEDFKGCEAVLTIDFKEPFRSFSLKGTCTRPEVVKDRKDLTAMSIVFNYDAVPIEYKIRINEYIIQQSRFDRERKREE